MKELIKYNPTSNGTMVPNQNGNWYFVEEVAQKDAVKRPSPTNKLVAEIAALADEHSSNAKVCGGNYFNLVHKLQQLVAVNRS